MKVSICIPTFNRCRHLTNCLTSIIANRAKEALSFQVCIADNCSTDDTLQVVRRAQGYIDIKYHRNSHNLGIPRNFLKAVEMADGEFVWLIGDDDLLMPSAVQEVLDLIERHQDVDFFYVNSFHLTTEYVFSFPQPFDTSNLPANMKPFSSRTHSGKMKFINLVSPKISFDFLGGMFLAVFRRRNWSEHAGVLDAAAIRDSRVFSHFDNTFPHVKIFARAFANSNAYFCAKPLSVCLTGAREWAPMYALVHSVRLVEAVEEYRKNGLPYFRYLWCKNYALNNVIPDLVSMMVHRQRSGFGYVNPVHVILNSFLYPNFYLSLVSFFVRKSKLFFGALIRRLAGVRRPL
jgi:glycosyltransferase involved in cell wall biosynthesis